jgi:hypothetical protein
VFRHNPDGLLEVAGMRGSTVKARAGKPAATVRQPSQS